MTNKKDGGPAFPCEQIAHYEAIGWETRPIYKHIGGMSMRQYYAAAALQGLLANNQYMQDNLSDHPSAGPDMLRGLVAHTAF